MFFAIVFVSAFITSNCALSNKDVKEESNVCKDTIKQCAVMKKHCHGGIEYNAFKDVCKATCGLCKVTKMCPADHPFAYYKGKYCCKFNKEYVFPQLGSSCDGSEITASSMCCKDDSFVACPHGHCTSNKALKMCPEEHPFAYLKGTYCCKFNKEDVFAHFGTKCDGSELSASSMCCKDSKFVACPHGKCATNTAPKQCPADHPFAYSNGAYCCQFNKERSNPQFGASCDGSKISPSSKCCKDNKFVACPYGKCVSGPKQCPAEHPFAYFKGTYCCRFNKEGSDVQFGASCDGSEISSSSKCCKDNKFVECPHGKCVSAPKQCPRDHPFAYFNGAYCCQFNKERSNPQFGASCDGSKISSSSKCCKDNKFVACPHGKCVSVPISVLREEVKRITWVKQMSGDKMYTVKCATGVNGFRLLFYGNCLNGIQLRCTDKSDTAQVKGHPGDWKEWKTCGARDYIRGVNYRFDNGDYKNGARDINMRCSNGQSLEGGGKAQGTWQVSGYRDCLSWQKLCGLKVWTQSIYTLHKIEFVCC